MKKNKKKNAAEKQRRARQTETRGHVRSGNIPAGVWEENVTHLLQQGEDSVPSSMKMIDFSHEHPRVSMHATNTVRRFYLFIALKSPSSHYFNFISKEFPVFLIKIMPFFVKT